MDYIYFNAALKRHMKEPGIKLATFPTFPELKRDNSDYGRQIEQKHTYNKSVRIYCAAARAK